MKMACIWFLISAALSMILLVESTKVIPTGKKFDELSRISTELGILSELISSAPVSEETLQNRYSELLKEYKGAVIFAQIETLPIAIYFYPLLFLNIVNVLVAIVMFFLNRAKNQRINQEGSV